MTTVTTIPTKIDRIQTGIGGFDELIGGGLVRGDVHIITGGPGTGKTIFTSNMVYNAITNLGETVIYASFEESAEYFKRNMKKLGMDFAPLEKDGKIKILDLDALGGKELESNVSLLLTAVEQTKSSILVIDSLTALLMACNTKLEIRTFVKMIYKEVKKRKITTIMTVSLQSGGRLGAEGFICDSVILLENVIEEYQFRTRLMILKMRATDHSRKYHSVIFQPKLTISRY